jgi:threonine dehydratase
VGATTLSVVTRPIPTPDDVVAAHRRIVDHVHRTPVMTSRTVNGRVGAEVHFKCENFQRIGAFKIRGALNALSRLSPEERERGVLTYSSGNHAQAVALAGAILGIDAEIVMPEDAPAVKLEATRGYGGRVVLYDRRTQAREDVARARAADSGRVIVPPYDHSDVVAGQGTAALELFDEVGTLDLLLTPCGGAGLLSGSALAARLRSPKCRVIGVEPEAGDDATRSFHTGELHRVHEPDTICDGARTPCLGTVTFPLVRRYVDDMVTVSDQAVIRAMKLVWERMKLVIEPTAALPLAALLEGRVQAEGRRIGVILSGGNVDVAGVARWFG